MSPNLKPRKGHGLKLVYVISNNQSLGWIKYLQEKNYSRRVMSTEYGPIDFVKVSKAKASFPELLPNQPDISCS